MIKYSSFSTGNGIMSSRQSVMDGNKTSEWAIKLSNIHISLIYDHIILLEYIIATKSVKKSFDQMLAQFQHPTLN